MTQCDRILEYMQNFGSITQFEALRDLGCMRLASRISDLRKAGYDISKRMVTETNRYGEKVTFAKYTLHSGQ